LNQPHPLAAAATRAPREAENPARLLEIDLLRFVAAVLVVFYHWAFRGQAADGLSQFSYPELAGVAKYGYLGVDLFFVISGFVIFSSARSGSLRGFVVSRFIRLYPAFWVCCTLTFVGLHALRATRPELQPSVGHYLANLTMFSGFFDIPSVDGAYWTLFVEMRFYIFVSIVLALGWMRHAERLLWLWLFAAFLALVTRRGQLAVWLIAPYAALFVAGALLYLVHQSGWTRSRVLMLLCAGAMAIAYRLSTLAEHAAHYNTPYSPWVVGLLVAAIFVLMTLMAVQKLAWLRHRAWLQWGVMTYPLYLLHQNLGYALFDRWMPDINRHLLFWGALALVLALAYATNRWVERPVSAYLKLRLSPKPHRQLGGT
jgi:peptidoglycan/LPS O-acetylase OafA/YrhL